MGPIKTSLTKLQASFNSGEKKMLNVQILHIDKNKKQYWVEQLNCVTEPSSSGGKEEMKFQLNDQVTKISGSSWRGRICGTYSTHLTPEGYVVESNFEPGSVQLYPAAALRLTQEKNDA